MVTPFQPYVRPQRTPFLEQIQKRQEQEELARQQAAEARRARLMQQSAAIRKAAEAKKQQELINSVLQNNEAAYLGVNAPPIQQNTPPNFSEEDFKPETSYSDAWTTDYLKNLAIGLTPLGLQRDLDLVKSGQGVELGNWFGSGLVETVATVGSEALKRIEPVLSFGIGAVSRLIPGEQQFDRDFRQVIAERKQSGTGTNGILEFLNSHTEAARRSQPLQRLSEYSSGMAFLLQPAVAERASQVYKENTGEDFDISKILHGNNFAQAMNAVREGYLQIDQPKFVKGTAEVLTDPTNFIPFGLGVKGAKAGVKAVRGLGKVAEDEAVRGLGKVAEDAAEQGARAATVNVPKEVAVTADRVTGYTPDFVSSSKIDSFTHEYDFVDAGTGVPLKTARQLADDRIVQNAENLRQVATDEILHTQDTVLGRNLQRTSQWLRNHNLSPIAETLDVSARFFSPRTGTDMAEEGVRKETLIHAATQQQMINTARQNVERHVANTGTVADSVKKTNQATGASMVAEDGFVALSKKTSEVINDKALLLARRTSAKGQGDAGLFTSEAARKRGFWQKRNLDDVPDDGLVDWLPDELAWVLFDVVRLPGNENILEFVLRKEFKELPEFYDVARQAETSFVQKLRQDANFYLRQAKEQADIGLPISKRIITTVKDAKGKLITQEVLLSGRELANAILQEKAYLARLSLADANKSGFSQEALIASADRSRARFGNKLHDGIESGQFRYASPEETMMAYVVGHANVAAEKMFQHNLIEMLAKNPDVAERYGVIVLKQGEKLPKDFPGVQIGRSTATGREIFTRAKQAGDKIDPSMWDRFLFRDVKSASKFASDANVIIRDGGVGSLQYALSQGLRPFQAFSEVSRLMGSSFDLGTVGVYGLPLVGKGVVDLVNGVAKRDAKLIAQGKAGIKSIGQAYVNQVAALIANRNLLNKAIQSDPIGANLWKIAGSRGLEISKQGADAYAAANRGSDVSTWLGRVMDSVDNKLEDMPYFKELSRGARQLGTGTVQRFEFSFSTALDTLRYTHLRSLAGHLDLNNPEDLKVFDEIINFINRATGSLNTARMGKSGLQRQVESTIISYSPRMTQAIGSLVMDAFTRGGVQGTYARQAVFGGIAAITGFMWFVGQMLGQDVELDPTESHWLQVQVGDDWIGPQSKMLTFFKSATMMIDRPDDREALFDSLNTDKSYKDSKFFKLVRQYAAGAPVGSALTGALTGENYLGEPYSDGLSWAAAQSSQLLPFYARDLDANDPTKGTSVSTRILEATLGLRTRPLSVYERRKDALNKASANMFNGKEYDYLNDLQRKQLFAALDGQVVNVEGANIRLAENFKSDYATAQALLENNRSKYGVASELIDNYYSEVGSINESYKNSINKIVQNLGERGTPGEFRSQLNALKLSRSAQLDRVYDPEGENAAVLDYFAKLKDVSSVEDARDVAYQVYRDTVLDITKYEKISEDGVAYIDWDARKSAESDFAAKYGADTMQYVKALLATGKDLNPLEAELNIIRDIIGPVYWDSTKKASIDHVAKRFNYASEQVTALYNQYLIGNSTTQEQLGQLQVIKDIKSTQRKIQEGIRQQNAAIDGFLYRWDYTKTLLNEGNKLLGGAEYWRDLNLIDDRDYIGFYANYGLPGFN